MSVQEELPDIPRIPPPTLKALSRLCAGKDSYSSRQRIVESPCLVDIGDDIFVIFTDGCTAVLVQLDPEEDIPELESGESIQHSANMMLKAFSIATPGVTVHANVDVGMLTHWMSEGTTKCPKCAGKRTCMFPRLHSESYNRENQEVLAAHVGRINDVYLDRRRLQLPLSFLGVEEGAADVILTNAKRPDGAHFSGVAIIGDGWHVYTAGRLVGAEEESLYEKCPRINL